MAQRQKYFYANKDKDGFPVPGTMMSYDRPLDLTKVKNKMEIKNSYSPLPCQTVLRNKRGLRYFVEVDSYGDIIPNRLFSALYPPKNINYVEILNIVGTPCAIVSMKNFLNTTTPGYPVGVWNVSGTYINTAATQNDVITVWNSDPANQSVGQIIAGPTSTSFYFIGATPPAQIRCLRYYRYTGPASLEIFVGLNDIIKYGSTTKTGLADSTAVFSDTRLEWNRVLWTTDYNIKIPNTTVRFITCTGNPDSTPVFIFHNEDSEYIGTKFFPPNGGTYSFSGALPIATKAVSLRGASMDYNDINNWSELTSIWSICNFSAGGGIWKQNNPAFWPTTLNFSQITQLKLGQSDSGSNNSVLLLVNQTIYPNVIELLYDSFGPGFTGQEGWFLTMPKVTRYLYLQSGTNSTAVSDSIWNNIATTLTGITPVVGSQARLRVRTTTAVSAASLVSRTYLAAQGWTVSLS